MIFIFSSVIFILSFIYYYLSWNYNFWQKQGIPCAKGIIPGLGNMASTIFRGHSLAKLCEDYYNANNYSMFGFYRLTTPALLIRDPELVKSVLLTNFHDFHNNDSEISCPKEDALLSINPFFAKSNEIWKDNRAPLTNAFSSKKLKLMLPLIQDAALGMEEYLKRKINLQNEKFELELKKFFNLYTGEIGATGIGIQGHNFQDDDTFTKDKVTIKKIIETLFQGPAFRGGLTEFTIRYWPRLAKLLNIYMTPKDVDLFFRHSVRNIISYRKNDNKSHNDFLQIIIDYFKANGSKYDEETIIASYMLSFSIEVYETSAMTLSYLGFQLAANPDIQEKVREEVMSLIAKNNGKLDYETLNEMPYLEQVLHESMRLNHIAGILTRVCTKETQLIGSDGLSCKLKPGNVIVLSTSGLQMDPKYWPNPEKFDPDRFNEEQKAEKHKFTFIPFGEGPRICVGIRLAKIMMKMAIATILKNYSLQVSPKTSLPLKKNPATALTVIEGGLWVFLKPLKINS